MRNAMCLMAVVLVGASHQRAPIVSSTENGIPADALSSTAYVEHDKVKQNIEYEEPTVVLRSLVAPQACRPCTCGSLGRRGKIVGGTIAYANQYPWMAMLLAYGKFYCGASLINSKYVLTAAHCFISYEKKDVKVRLLEHDLRKRKDAKHVDFKVLNVIKHEGYNVFSKNNDIALVRLDIGGAGLGSNAKINPVCLPPGGNSFAGRKAVVTGWGLMAYGGSASEVLRQVKLPIMRNGDCGKTDNGPEVLDTMLCAGYAAGEKDACQGDSGGPLHVKIDSTYYIAGIVSWGKGCAQANRPGVYTRVSKYLDWIKNNTRDACPCSDPNHKAENNV